MFRALNRASDVKLQEIAALRFICANWSDSSFGCTYQIVSAAVPRLFNLFVDLFECKNYSRLVRIT